MNVVSSVSLGGADGDALDQHYHAAHPVGGEKSFHLIMRQLDYTATGTVSYMYANFVFLKAGRMYDSS